MLVAILMIVGFVGLVGAVIESIHEDTLASFLYGTFSLTCFTVAFLIITKAIVL